MERCIHINSKQNGLIKTQNFKCLQFKLDSYKRGNAKPRAP